MFVSFSIYAKEGKFNISEIKCIVSHCIECPLLRSFFISEKSVPLLLG